MILEKLISPLYQVNTCSIGSFMKEEPDPRSPEVGPYIRLLSCRNQNINWILIFMENIPRPFPSIHQIRLNLCTRFGAGWAYPNSQDPVQWMARGESKEAEVFCALAKQLSKAHNLLGIESIRIARAGTHSMFADKPTNFSSHIHQRNRWLTNERTQRNKLQRISDGSSHFISVGMWEFAKSAELQSFNSIEAPCSCHIWDYFMWATFRVPAVTIM